MMPIRCSSHVVWHGCYTGAWDYWTEEAHAHPAKMAPGLCHRIFEHLKELGLLKPGATILDPMGGIGTTGLVAASLGHPALLVELESRFIDLAKGNKERLERRLGRGLPIEIVQGDARRLSELLVEGGLVAVSSPPYSDTDVAGDRKKGIANLQAKLVRGELKGRESIRIAHKGQWNPHTQNAQEGYGLTPGQIGNLPGRPIAITSPPYTDTFSPREGGEIKPEWGKHREKRGKDLAYNPDNPANIGNLPDRPLTAITSPPWQVDKGTKETKTDDSYWYRGNMRNPGPHSQLYGKGYGQASGQLGQEQGDTYLLAMRQVYAELARVADVLVVVVKNPTRNGKLRRLDLDTIALLEATGWTIHCQHRAILFEEQEQGHLFEGSQKQVRGRMSFFKRLAYRKGSPVARHEDIIFATLKGGHWK